MKINNSKLSISIGDYSREYFGQDNPERQMAVDFCITFKRLADETYAAQLSQIMERSVDDGDIFYDMILLISKMLGDLGYIEIANRLQRQIKLVFD